jgi:hypothetical protein
MKYKGQVAAICLCIALANVSTPVNAELIASHSPAQFQPHEKSAPPGSSEDIKTTLGQKEQVELNMLDTIWIVSFAIAGLVLLRKIQGE